jgi:hypothetical protein
MSPLALLLAKDGVDVSGVASAVVGAHLLSLVPSRKARRSWPQPPVVILPEGAAAETKHEALSPRYVASVSIDELFFHCDLGLALILLAIPSLLCRSPPVNRRCRSAATRWR